MSEDSEDKAKYQIEMGQAYRPVIGDYTHVEQHFQEASVSPPPASREELLSAIREASAELRAYPSDIADIHLVRSETAQIVEWALNAEPKEHLGMLLDQPGGGKTVVIYDVLKHLGSAQIATCHRGQCTLQAEDTCRPSRGGHACSPLLLRETISQQLALILERVAKYSESADPKGHWHCVSSFRQSESKQREGKNDHFNRDDLKDLNASPEPESTRTLGQI
jgi:hypothetical protein